MQLSRRTFIAHGAIVAGAFAFAPLGLGLPTARGAWTRLSDDYFDWKPLKDGALAAFGEGGNALLAASKGKSLLVDCKNAPFGASLRREAERRGATLAAVVNTHHHADHTGGNPAFARDVPLYAHPAVRNRVAAQLDRYKAQIEGGLAQIARSQRPGKDEVLAEAKALAERVASLTVEDFAPTEPLANSESLRVGDLTVIMRHFGRGHTDNDVIVHIPELDILHMGDLLFHGLHPYWDADASPSSAGWIEACKRAAGMCGPRTIVVPGHGEITDVSGIRKQIAYFEAVRQAAAKARTDGVSREDFLKIELPIFEGLGFEQVKPRVLGGVYDEAAGGS